MSAKRRADDKQGKKGSKKKREVVDLTDEEDEDSADDIPPMDMLEDNNGSGDGLADNLRLPSKSKDECGTLLIAGSMNWDITGRKSLPKGCKDIGKNIWSPHTLASMEGKRVRLVASGSNACHCVLVNEEGQAMSWGRNDFGQLGLGDLLRRDEPTLIETLKDEIVVAVGCGRRHTLFLTDRGIVYACGDNKLGQCGIGKPLPIVNVPTRLNYRGPPLIKVGCGGEFSVVLDIKGALHSFGCPEYGQLGHNTDGKYFVSCNKLGFHTETAAKRIVFFIEKAKDGHINPVEVEEIIDFSVGSNHTVAIDNKRRVFSWGWGGFGRLGHAEQKDEMIPRLIKFFDTQSKGVKSVHCGSSFSLALNEHGAVYLFGQTKRTGEANMYPKPIQDLSGWNVRAISCGFTSIVVAADDSVIAWGSSPTYGELGYGELQKSSTVPKELKPLEDIYVTNVACGMGHTLYIARDNTPEERTKISNLPSYTPQ